MKRLATQRNRELLLEMARRGEPRPYAKTSLYRTFVRWTKQDEKTYKAEFTAELKKLAPHWFDKSQRRARGSAKPEVLAAVAWKPGMPHPTGGSRYRRLMLEQKAQRTSGKR